MNIDSILDNSYYSQTAGRLAQLSASGALSKTKSVRLNSYLTKTKMLQGEWKIKGYSPWKERLLKDRRDVLDAVLNDFAGNSESSGNFTIPDEEFYKTSQTSIEKGVQSGALNPEETSYLKSFLLKSRKVHTGFASEGLSTFSKMLISGRTKMFSSLLQAYMEGDFKPRASIKD